LNKFSSGQLFEATENLRKVLTRNDSTLLSYYQKRDSLLWFILDSQHELVAWSGGFKESRLHNCEQIELCIVNPFERKAVNNFLFNKNGDFGAAKEIIDRLLDFDKNTPFVTKFYDKLILFQQLDGSDNVLDISIFFDLNAQEALFVMDQIAAQLLLYELNQTTLILQNRNFQ
jgi:hypothetical protein